jgi:hypothetical protein
MHRQMKKWLAPLEEIQTFETVWLILKYSLVRKSNKSLPELSHIFTKAVELFTNRLKIVRKDNSFAGEHQILVETMKNIHIEEGYLADIGAADGIRQSSTLGFLHDSKWKGTLFEYNPESFSRLAFLYGDSERVNLAKTKVTPLNVVALFDGFNVPKNLEFLNIDIDSYDLSILRELIDFGYRPRIISMEVNEKFPPNLYFEVLYSAKHVWAGDHFFGCSLVAAYENLQPRGYEILTMEYNNVIFLESTFTQHRKSEIDLGSIYRNGYLAKQDRKTLFPWNEDFELILEMDSESAIEFLNKKFQIYSGKYRLENR